jgi:molybdenum cofactor cytidylyltransferase
MRFGPVPLEHAEGHILGHNVTGDGGRRLLRKGRPLTAHDVATLRQIGRRVIYVAIPEAGDIDEDSAALRVSRAVVGDGIRLQGPSTGRVNLYATTVGVVRVDVEALDRLNGHDGITLATLVDGSAVGEGKMVGTTKILPYAIPEIEVRDVESEVAGRPAILRVDALSPRRAGLVLAGSRGAEERVVSSFRGGLEPRLHALGSTLERSDYVVLEEESGAEALGEAIERQLRAGIEIVLLAGETAIMDRHDIAPRAVELAGGEVVCFGAPVDPGNLLMLGYVGSIPVIGAPGCARSPKRNIVDLVLPRLLVGERLDRRDIVAMGHGGLLEDVPERPMPRSRI